MLLRSTQLSTTLWSSCHWGPGNERRECPLYKALVTSPDMGQAVPSYHNSVLVLLRPCGVELKFNDIPPLVPSWPEWIGAYPFLGLPLILICLITSTFLLGIKPPASNW
jgi:hypothetical protein